MNKILKQEARTLVKEAIRLGRLEELKIHITEALDYIKGFEPEKGEGFEFSLAIVGEEIEARIWFWLPESGEQRPIQPLVVWFPK